RWMLTDAQIDSLHRNHLRVAFDPTDLPSKTFLNAGEAWTAWRSGKINAAAFGHGESRGAWFLRVNLMRDLLALRKQETSDWDSWRSIPEDRKALDDQALADGDRIAAMTRETGRTPP
ncbi:MAG: hypothetical protein ACM3II_14905, partial [Rhodospirillaceae bacterium]